MPAEIENYVHRRILSYNIRKAWQLPVLGGINYFGSGDTEENFLSSTVQDSDAYLHVHQFGHCLLHVLVDFNKLARSSSSHSSCYSV